MFAALGGGTRAYTAGTGRGEDPIGPDILIFNATFFIKEPGTGQVTAWHQDATYFGMQPYDHVTAWTPSRMCQKRRGGGFCRWQFGVRPTLSRTADGGGQCQSRQLGDRGALTEPQSRTVKPGQFSFIILWWSAARRRIVQRSSYRLRHQPYRRMSAMSGVTAWA